MKKIINKDNNLTKIGLIGLGRWGKNIVKSCQQISTLKLTCVASGNPDNKKLIPNDCYFSSNATITNGGDCNNLTINSGATLIINSSILFSIIVLASLEE